MDNRIETAIKQVKRGKPAYVIVFDIDTFKKFNDTYSNHAGHLVLKTIAMLAKEIFAERGFVARYGGEEFSVILFEKPLFTVQKRPMNFLRASVLTNLFIKK